MQPLQPFGVLTIDRGYNTLTPISFVNRVMGRTICSALPRGFLIPRQILPVNGDHSKWRPGLLSLIYAGLRLRSPSHTCTPTSKSDHSSCFMVLRTSVLHQPKLDGKKFKKRKRLFVSRKWGKGTGRKKPVHAGRLVFCPQRKGNLRVVSQRMMEHRNEQPVYN